jgi:cytochrome c oxidase subunit I
VLGQSGLDLSMHDTYFVLGHFHLVMGVAAVFGIFAATYFWFPKMFGRLMNEKAGKLHFYLTFIGVYSIFIPFHVMGIGGMPRRYSQFTEFRYLDSLQPLVLFVTIAAILTAAAQLIFVLNFFWSMFRGKRADSNPWEATTLEWDTSSPPPHDNFGGREVIVYRGPYEYSVPGHARDYAPQSSSNTETGE